MRTLSALVALVLLAAGPGGAKAADTETIDAVKTAFGALDDAFARRDANAIRRLMTADHVAVTPYYDGPQSVAEQIRSLPDLELKETPVSGMTVTLLGPDAALITFVADVEGRFTGTPLAPRGFVSSVMVRRDGRWLEHFYQVTTLQP